jgi:hypothetical protein
LPQAFWGKTHVDAPAGAEIPGDRAAEINGKLNRRQFGNESGTTGRAQNRETKPILRPMAE